MIVLYGYARNVAPHFFRWQNGEISLVKKSLACIVILQSWTFVIEILFKSTPRHQFIMVIRTRLLVLIFFCNENIQSLELVNWKKTIK